jgi:hypothetical protein
MTPFVLVFESMLGLVRMNRNRNRIEKIAEKNEVGRRRI